MNEKKKGIKQWQRDFAYGVVLVLFSIINIIYASTLPAGSIRIKNAQAGTYLTIVMVALSILGAALAIRALIKKPDSIVIPLFDQPTIITIVWMTLYLIIMKKLGFFISSTLFVFGLIAYYSFLQGKLKEKGKTRIKQLISYAICALVVTFACQYLFGTVLTVVLPEFTLF